MLNGILENLEAMVINEGLQVDDSAVLESANIEVFDSNEYLSEIDEVRVDETAEIMADVFSEDVLANWADEYYIKAGENLGIDTKGVIVESMPSDDPTVVNMGYNSGDGYIHINADVLNDPSMLGQVLDTATHEMRHQFQNDVIDNPQNFGDIPQNVLEDWAYELTPGNYISPDYDYEGYYGQSIECDARDFAGDVLESYTEIMNLN